MVELKAIKQKYSEEPVYGGIYLILEENRLGLIEDYYLMIIGKEVLQNGELETFAHSKYLEYEPIIEDVSVIEACTEEYLRKNILENPFLGNRINYCLTSEIRNSLYICRKVYGSFVRLKLNSKIDDLRNRSLSFLYMKNGNYESIDFPVSQLDTNITILDTIAKNTFENAFNSLSLEQLKELIPQYYCIKRFGIRPPEGYGCSSMTWCEKCKECWSIPCNRINFSTEDLRLHNAAFTSPIPSPVKQ